MITGQAHPDKTISFAPLDAPRYGLTGIALWTPVQVRSSGGIFSVVLSAGRYGVSIDGIIWSQICVPDGDGVYSMHSPGRELLCPGMGIDWYAKVGTNDVPGYLGSKFAAGTNVILGVADSGRGDGSQVITIASNSGTLTLKDNFAASANPTSTDDSAHGYAIGSRWFNLSNWGLWECIDASAGAATWYRLALVDNIANEVIFTDGSGKPNVALGTMADAYGLELLGLGMMAQPLSVTGGNTISTGYGAWDLSASSGSAAANPIHLSPGRASTTLAYGRKEYMILRWVSGDGELLNGDAVSGGAGAVNLQSDWIPSANDVLIVEWDSPDWIEVTRSAVGIRNHTPASSSETNLLGATAMDSSFLYLWTATNVNKRIALTPW